MANRGQFGSKFGFIMAAAGSAVGLGNIWRFPYLTGENGGAAFVFIYLGCVILIGLPMLLNEIALGRMTGKNPIGAFKDTGSNKFWMIGAILSLCVSFFVTTYYGVIAGWTIGYIYSSLMGVELSFAEFQANPAIVIPLFIGFLGLNLLIVTKDISKGIEKASKILMPVLFVLLFVVIVRGLTLDGASAGLRYYLVPDFSKITASTFLKALSQCFFSMSIGWGIMITYGSYLSKNESIVKSALWIGLLDTSVALMGGLMVFPAVFAFGMEPNQGPTLVFQILPQVFNAMPGGNIVGAFFFLLLCIAALTSTISMIEVPGSWLVDEKKWSRKKAAWVVVIIAIVVGIPSALSKGANDTLTNMSINFSGLHISSFMDIMDFIWGSFFIVIVSLFVCLYVGWVIGPKKIIAELSEGTPTFSSYKIFGLITAAQLWSFFIRFVCPIVILIVILNQFNIFG